MKACAAQLSDVRFAYDGRAVLNGASLALAPGEFGVLVGDNGAGKSTIINLLLGSLTPQVGRVQVCGKPPASAAAYGFVGYVPQQSPSDYRYFPVTVLEMVRNAAPHDGSFLGRRSRAGVAARKVLAEVGLAGRESALVGELSGGQFQAALLARALVGRPNLLLLDESTSNLDDAHADKLMRAVADATAKGTAVLLVTHDLARLPRVFDRGFELLNGVVAPFAPESGRRDV